MKRYLVIAFLLVYQAGMGQQVLFVAAGQSNSVGQGDAAQSVKTAHGWEYCSQGDSLARMLDPVGENALDFQRANTGSAWPAFAARYFERTGREVVLVPAARGGSSCHEKAELSDMGTWYPTGRKPLFENAILKIQQAERKTGLKTAGIIWLQGERDANAIFDQKMTPAEYEQALEELITRFRSRLGRPVPFYIVLTGNQDGREPIGNEAVRKAQRSVAKRLPDVQVVYEDTPLFPAQKRMKDFVHYGQDALNEIGRVVAEKVK